MPSLYFMPSYVRNSKPSSRGGAGGSKVAKIVNNLKRDPFEIRPVRIAAHGPAVTHNMPCSVCWTNPAVADSGKFQPCWTCQSEGWELRKRKRPSRRIFHF